jgi:D-sedoheptulose 7-phosphate isomerase
VSARFTRPLPTGADHLDHLTAALGVLRGEVGRLERWGADLRAVLGGGGRLLTCGNGGSAAEAQHLTAELVGRYRDDRAPFSAICLSAESSSCTAIGNDYGPDEVFARQVRAHGRPGDVLLALSTSGASGNVVAAARAARETGLQAWALTGRGPNPLTDACDDALCVPTPHTATIQEVHLVALHVVCAAFDEAGSTLEATVLSPPREAVA